MSLKIIFKYSWIYDNIWKDYLVLKKGKSKIEFLSQKKIANYTKIISKLWEKEGEKILKEISNSSKLKWRRKQIICYIIGAGRSISDPLTIKVFKNKNDFIDLLIHELIHQILTQNKNQVSKYIKYLRRKYNDKSLTTQNHIILFAIYKKIMLKLFNKKRLNREFKRAERDREYLDAWKIMDEEGYENILKKFYEMI
ncbi:MAG: hypothetical protein WC584_01930 [Candidatus Pacearchaeota archaeon]